MLEVGQKHQREAKRQEQGPQEKREAHPEKHADRPAALFHCFLGRKDPRRLLLAQH